MAKKNSDDDDDGGLDSLLDTMTNVVGILVLVLIVTQMSVADVVTRITQENKVDEATLQELSEQVSLRKTEKDELQTVLVDPTSIDAEAQLKELERKQELLARHQKSLAEKQREKNEFALKIEQDREMAAKNEKLLKENEQNRKRLDSELTAAMDRRAELLAKLDRTPRVAAPADIKISIPNPRPPPDGAKQVVLVCSGDRIYPVNQDGFRATAEERMKLIIARYRLGQNPATGIDPEKFTPLWEKLKDQDEFFDVEYYVAGKRYPRLRFIPRDQRGATGKMLLNPRSPIRSQRWLGAIDPTKAYARFFVLPDSFGVYVIARRFFSESGVLAGWEPQNQDWQFSTGVPGGIELGPPRPEKPRPVRKPQNLID